MNAANHASFFSGSVGYGLFKQVVEAGMLAASIEVDAAADGSCLAGRDSQARISALLLPATRWRRAFEIAERDFNEVRSAT